MLALTIKVGESVWIDEVEVKVLERLRSYGSMKAIKLGIIAPPEVRILRQNLKNRMEAEAAEQQREAA